MMGPSNGKQLMEGVLNPTGESGALGSGAWDDGILEGWVGGKSATLTGNPINPWGPGSPGSPYIRGGTELS